MKTKETRFAGVKTLSLFYTVLLYQIQVMNLFPITYQNKIVCNCLDLFRPKSTRPTAEELWEINNMDVIRGYSENNDIIIRLMLSNRLWCEFIGSHWNTLPVNQKESQFTPFISRVTAQSIMQRSFLIKCLLYKARGHSPTVKCA